MMYPSKKRVPEKYQKSKAFLENDIRMLKSQVAELVNALHSKYKDSPDPDTKKLLIIHMGSEFFDPDSAIFGE